MLFALVFELNFVFPMQNKEAEKQVKFFQSCVAAAFAERDQALMEVIISKSSLAILWVYNGLHYPTNSSSRECNLLCFFFNSLKRLRNKRKLCRRN